MSNKYLLVPFYVPDPVLNMLLLALLDPSSRIFYVMGAISPWLTDRESKMLK